LVVGDESVPTVVGYTPEGMENSCAWVLKKELLGLEEVPSLLNKINQDKRRADKERGLREHEFFYPEREQNSRLQLCSSEKGWLGGVCQ
jgi:hypothetical protein